MAKPPFIWEAHEYFFEEKTSDWYWAVGIISVSAAVLAFLFDSFLFGLLILVGAFALALLASKPPRFVRFEVNKSGVLIDRELHPYGTLHSFWVEDNKHLEFQSKLFLKSKKLMMPVITIPMEGVDPEDIRDFLLDHVLEEHHYENVAQKIMEYLGF